MFRVNLSLFVEVIGVCDCWNQRNDKEDEQAAKEHGVPLQLIN